MRALLFLIFAIIRTLGIYVLQYFEDRKWQTISFVIR